MTANKCVNYMYTVKLVEVLIYMYLGVPLLRVVLQKQRIKYLVSRFTCQLGTLYTLCVLQTTQGLKVYARENKHISCNVVV